MIPNFLLLYKQCFSKFANHIIQDTVRKIEREKEGTKSFAHNSAIYPATSTKVKQIKPILLMLTFPQLHFLDKKKWRFTTLKYAINLKRFFFCSVVIRKHTMNLNMLKIRQESTFFFLQRIRVRIYQPWFENGSSIRLYL